MRPIALAANQPPQFYRGGAALATFRGDPVLDAYRPEDWIGSTTARHGSVAGSGLTRLPEGRLLRDAVRADPAGWLGAEHAEAMGPDPALLVKLLDAGETLPVHVHPSRSFAQRHLGSSFGKTEAWLVLGAAGPDARFHLGFARDVQSSELDRWIEDQDAGAMLENLNPIEVEVGDTILVPAGVPHAIGAGIFCLELQEPTDLSVMLEWAAFEALDPALARLGLTLEDVRECVQRTAVSAEQVARLRTSPVSTGDGIQRLFPEEADPFFRAELIDTAPGPVALDPGFSILVVLEGHGLADADGDALSLDAGSTVLVPHSAGAVEVSGGVRAVRCRPPNVEAAQASGFARMSQTDLQGAA